MIVLLRPDAPQAEIDRLLAFLHRRGISYTHEEGILRLRGETDGLSGFPAVQAVSRSAPALSSRRPEQARSVVSVGSAKFGADRLVLIAGPCCVEDETQIFLAAQHVRQAGAAVLRGGAFKPRTSPYDFAGLGAEGITLLCRAGRAVGLPVVTELMDVRQLELFSDVDLIQVGARNMQNFDLLHALGGTGKPILLKRGMGNTLRELLLSAEHIMAAGNDRIILCERGIRTFDDFSRFTLDLTAVPALHEMTHLPVIVDPSHARARLARRAHGTRGSRLRRGRRYAGNARRSRRCPLRRRAGARCPEPDRACPQAARRARGGKRSRLPAARFLSVHDRRIFP